MSSRVEVTQEQLAEWVAAKHERDKLREAADALLESIYRDVLNFSFCVDVFPEKHEAAFDEALRGLEVLIDGD